MSNSCHVYDVAWLAVDDDDDDDDDVDDDGAGADKIIARRQRRRRRRRRRRVRRCHIISRAVCSVCRYYLYPLLN